MRFRRDRRGNIAVIFAIAALPLISFVGAAIDYTSVSTVRTKLQAFQDMAVLSAISKTEMGATAAQAQADAIAFFYAQTSAKGLTANLSLSVTDNGGKRSVTSTFTSTIATSFMNVLGFPQMTVSNTSTGSLNLPSYIDFYLLLDNTPSMGLGATPADIATMQNNTPDQCAFACHNLDSSTSYYNVAKNNGVTMRIDVVRQATQKLTDTAQSSATLPNQFRMAVYTFGSSCTATGLTTIAPLSSSMSSVKSAASSIDLMTIPYQNYNNDQCTDFDSVLAAMNLTIPNPGPGTATSPQKYLFYVSDGVADASYPGSCSKTIVNGTRCQEPLKPADCAALKARGITVAVLYTTYLPLDQQGATNGGIGWYQTWIKPFTNDIATNMQSCASAGFYFEVSPTQGISEAMDALFRKAISKARLSS